MKCSPKERISEEDITKQVEKILEERGNNALEEAKNQILQEEFECKEVREALTYFMSQNWKDVFRHDDIKKEHLPFPILYALKNIEIKFTLNPILRKKMIRKRNAKTVLQITEKDLSTQESFCGKCLKTLHMQESQNPNFEYYVLILKFYFADYSP